MIERLLALVPGVGPASAALRFLTSTVGVALLAATLGFGAGLQTANHGAELRAAREELALVRKDLATTKGAAALATRQAAALEVRLKTNQDRVHDLQKRSPIGDCGLSSDLARRLSNIR